MARQALESDDVNRKLPRLLKNINETAQATVRMRIEKHERMAQGKEILYNMASLHLGSGLYDG